MPLQRFSCKECPKSYPNSHGLKRHNKIHTGEPHYCSLCNKGFPNETEQRKHRKICILSARTASFSCNNCGNAFARKSDLSAHTKSCSRKYYSKPSNPAKAETKQNLNPEIIQCQFCDKPFTNFEEWKEHEEAEAEGLNAKNNINSVFAGLEGDFFDDEPVVIEAEYLSNQEPLSTDTDNDPFVMDIDTDSNEKAKTSSKTNGVKENAVIKTKIISAVKALDSSNIDTPKNEEVSKPVNDWNGLAKWIAEKNEASYMTLQGENEPKTSTANLPDSIKDKLKEVQDIANKMDTSLEHSDVEEDLTKNNSNKGVMENRSKESGYTSVNSYVSQAYIENDRQDKIDYQCKECNKKYESMESLKIHNYSHNRRFFCEICLKGFSDSSKLSRHKEGRDHKLEQSNSLKTGGKFEPNASLKTPVSEHKSKFSKDQLLVLTNYFDKHKHLQKEDEKEICQKTNIPLKSIKMWFINRRRYYTEDNTETKISPIVTDNISKQEDNVNVFHQTSNEADLKTLVQAQFDIKTRNENIQISSQVKSTEQLYKEFTNDNKTHFCDTCQQDFFSKKNLIRHMNTGNHKAKLRRKADDDTQKNILKQESFLLQDMQQGSFQSKANNTDIQNSSMSYQNVPSHHDKSYQQYMSIKDTQETTVNKDDINNAQNDTAKDDTIESPPSPGPEIITEIPRQNNPISSYSSEPYNDMNTLHEKARRYDTMQALRPMFGVMMQQMSAFYQTLFQTTAGLPAIQQNDQFGRPIQHQNGFNNGFNGYPGTYAPITYNTSSGYPNSWDNPSTQFNNGYSPSPMPTMTPPNNAYAPPFTNYGQQYNEFPQTNSRVVYSPVVPDKPVYSDPRKPTNNHVEVVSNIETTQCDSTTNIEVSGSTSKVGSGQISSPTMRPQTTDKTPTMHPQTTSKTPDQPMQPQSFESRNPSAFSSPLAVNTPTGATDGVPMDLSAK